MKVWSAPNKKLEPVPPEAVEAIVILPPLLVKVMFEPCRRSASVKTVLVAFKAVSNWLWKPG